MTGRKIRCIEVDSMRTRLNRATDESCYRSTKNVAYSECHITLFRNTVVNLR